MNKKEVFGGPENTFRVNSVPRIDEIETKNFPKNFPKNLRKLGFVAFGVDFGFFGEIGLSRNGCTSKGVTIQWLVRTRSPAERPFAEACETLGVQKLILGGLKV